MINDLDLINGGLSIEGIQMMRLGLSKIRLFFQIVYTIFTNGYTFGYINGTIYKGNGKYACVPGLNCYSCPGAVASCPLGALQNALNSRNLHVPFAVLGFLFIFGSIFGRFVCGWLCPFGLFQDLIYKIPIFKKKKNLPFHKILKYIKYLVLVGLVFIGSIFLFGNFVKVPAFCKYLCPSGTLMGAIPLISNNEQLQLQVRELFYWKLGILIFIIILSIKVYRPFCQYLCPLGAIYGWFNRFSLVQINWNKDECTSCMQCQKVCPINLLPKEISVSPECIKCGKCVEVCKVGCLCFKNKKAVKKI